MINIDSTDTIQISPYYHKWNLHGIKGYHPIILSLDEIKALRDQCDITIKSQIVSPEWCGGNMR